MMMARNQQKMVDDYDLQPFEANVLHSTRTLCEKIMSLVRFSYSEQPIEALRSKVRHVYDLHKMLKNEDLRSFFDSEEFGIFICKVARDDVESFRNNNEWLRHHPNESLLFRGVEEVWRRVRTAYVGDFKGLVYGNLPTEEQVLGSLVAIRDRLAEVEWQVTIPEPE